MERTETVDSAQAVAAQLDRIVGSPHFRHSSRYPALLRYLVEQTQEGNGAMLKERLLGIEVFHRVPNYDTNADPVVRVTAGEVRKRIAQYYQEPEHRGELRIELPVGSYIPRFLEPEATLEEPPQPPLPLTPPPTPATQAAPDPIREAPSPPPPAKRWLRWAAMAAAVAVGAASTLGYLALSRRSAMREERLLSDFWLPIAAEQTPVLVVVGHHSMDRDGKTIPTEEAVPNVTDQVILQLNRSSQVTISDLIGLLHVDGYMAQHRIAYRAMGAGSANLGDLRAGPVVLFAGLDNRWTIRLLKSLRYRFANLGDDSIGQIDDAKDPTRHWRVDFNLPYAKLPEDYAIIARYQDPLLDQPVIVAAGVGETGTAAASEFITQERFLQLAAAVKPGGLKTGNMEFVLAVPVVDGHAGHPSIIASEFW